MDSSDQYQSIVASIKDKGAHKLRVLEQVKLQFVKLKIEIDKLAIELCSEVDCLHGVDVKFTEKGLFQAELKFGEDVIIFFLHNDVFDFDKSHRVWKNSYVKNDRNNAFCGMISIFNFLNTSFEMNRTEDLGYLIGRLFINSEAHYFVEGKKQLGFLYNDFGKDVLSSETLRKIIMTAVQYCQEFDLLTPPFDTMSQVQVGQMIDISNKMNWKTGKRLGFKFSTDENSEE